MNKIGSIVGVLLLVAASVLAQDTTKAKGGVALRPVMPASFVTHGDAEQILGERAKVTDSTWQTGVRVSRLNSSYTALDEDDDGKLGALYLLFEDYSDSADAHHKYHLTFTANAGNGAKVLDGIGNEAYFHSDGENFLYFMARKGRYVLTLKVNKITEHTSRDAFMDIAKRVIREL